MYKYTGKATEAIKLAERLAIELGHNYIGTEHLLYGLVGIEDSVSGKILNNLGLNVSNIKEAIVEVIGKGRVGNQITGFTPKVKRVVEVAYMEARNEGIGYIGTEHILVAIIKEGESVATRIMLMLNVEPQLVLSEIDKMYFQDEYENANEKSNSRESQTPTLNEFGRDLTQMARDGKIDPVIGRENELQRLIQI